MNSEEIIILFICSYKKELYNGKLYLKEDSEKMVESHQFNEILINESKYKKYQFDIQEIKINKQRALESKKTSIKMNFSLSNLKKEKKVEEYDGTFNFIPNRSNFLFDYKIGNSLSQTINTFNYVYDKGCNLEFNEIFYSFHDYIDNKMSPKYQTEMLESLGEDTKNYLEKNKNENIKINFDIIFFLLINSRNKDISLLLELINKQNISYHPYDKLFKIEEIVLFVEEIIENLEKDENSWPFDEIRKFDKKGDGEELNEEEYKNKIKDKINTEDHFMEFLIGYFCADIKFTNYLSLFFKNEKIKKKTSTTISKIKNDKYITKIGRNKFMDFYDTEKEILSLLNAQTNFIKYLSIINSNVSNLYNLITKVGLSNFKIKEKILSFYDDILEINKLHKEILNKEKSINNFYIDFLSCIPEYIILFRNNNLDKLINLIEFIEDEKKINNKQIIIIKPFEDALRSNINETILSFIKKRCINETTYYIKIIPKIKTFFMQFKETDKFIILEASNINSSINAKDILEIIISNKINELFQISSYSKYFNTIINNISGIHYLPQILQIIPEEKYTKDIADKLFNWVIQNFQNYDSKKNINLEILLNKVLIILVKQKSSNSSKFVKQIKKSFNDEFVLKCFIIFIRNNLPNNINEEIIDYFTNSLKKKSFTNDFTILPYILQELKELKNITSSLFNKIKIYVIKEVEFFKKKMLV